MSDKPSRTLLIAIYFMSVATYFEVSGADFSSTVAFIVSVLFAAMGAHWMR